VAVQHVDNLRIAYDLTGARRYGFYLDPSKPISPVGDLGLWHWIYGGLMRPDRNGVLVPDLAESATVVDDSTVEVKLRPGLTFPDGSPLNATVAANAIEANLANQTTGYGKNFYKATGVSLVDDTTFRINVSDGIAAGWADSYLGSQETLIVPAGTNFAAPAGAGPYKVTSYVDGQSLVLEKNPDYWDADSIHIDRIELVNAGDTTASANALIAGQVDWTAKLDQAALAGIPGKYTVEGDPDAQFLMNLAMCKQQAPFDDVRVRQALNLAIDRNAINEAVFDGRAEVADSLWPEGNPLHDASLDGANEYNPARAKELLAEAGHPNGFTFDLAVEGPGGGNEVSQIVQQQLADIGVTMNLVPVTNYLSEFLQSKKTPVAISPSIPGRTTGRLTVFTGSSIANVCSYSDPQVDSLAQQLLRTDSDSDQYVQLWHQLDERLHDQVSNVLIVFRPNLIGFDPSVVSHLPVASYTIPVPDIRSI
jgi:peptide/nickel transport system substrate-binding protein